MNQVKFPENRDQPSKGVSGKADIKTKIINFWLNFLCLKCIFKNSDVGKNLLSWIADSFFWKAISIDGVYLVCSMPGRLLEWPAP